MYTCFSHTQSAELIWFKVMCELSSTINKVQGVFVRAVLL